MSVPLGAEGGSDGHTAVPTSSGKDERFRERSVEAFQAALAASLVGY